MKTALLIVGTRPEAIKMAPVILAARNVDHGVKPLVCLTGQHPDLARQALGVFGITADVKLDCVPSGGDLCRTASSVIQSVGDLLDARKPDVLVVQGDTLSALAAGLAAALRKVPLAHVEAGLRSGDIGDPFPEEISRRQLSHLAQWNFAPTQRAVDNLLAEGIDAGSIHCVGNTVIDAIRIVQSRMDPQTQQQRRSVLVTAHRRENWGEPMQRICQAVGRLAGAHTECRFVFSLHPNPDLQNLIRNQLGNFENVQLPPSPGYEQWVRQLLDCDLILTDSGGLQEEGSALGKPILVLRETTERPEAIESGNAVLVGTDTDAIVTWAHRLLTDHALHRSMSQPADVFGDGHAAPRILAALDASASTSIRLDQPVCSE